MKKLSILSALLFTLLCLEGYAQTIRRCNNDPNVLLGLNMYRTLQDAHDAAVANDIIYVEPSYNGASYGSLICVKTLRIIGNGYDQDQNTSINPTWDYRSSIVGAITIEAGAGTVLQGLYLPSNQIIIKATNVNVTRCKISSISLNRLSASQDASGAVISHNFQANYNGITVDYNGYDVYNATTCVYTAYQIQNVTIKNNNNIRIIYSSSGGVRSGGNCTTVPATTLASGKNFTITNNIILNATVYYNGYILASIKDCQSCTVHSNIFRSTSTTGILTNCPSTVSSYNVCGTNPCGFGTNNVDAANENLLFVGGTTLNYDKDFQLSNASPAKDAGLGGVDAGAFGTNDPYRLSGLAPIPQITTYSKNASSGVYTNTVPMTVTISVRGNN